MTDFVCRSALSGLIFGLTLLASCGRSEVGVYVSEKKPMNTLELRGDGTFLNTENSRMFTGKYRIDGNKLILELPTGQAVTGSINGNVVVDPDGDKLIKK